MTTKQQPEPDYNGIVDGYFDEIMEIDSMPLDGPRQQRYTAFQKRRHGQMNFMLGVWTEFFPDHPKPTYAELQDYLGAVKDDSLATAMYFLAKTAERMHIGRGKIWRNRDGTPKVDKNGKKVWTRRKIGSPLSYAKKLARTHFKDAPENRMLPAPPEQQIPETSPKPVTIRELSAEEELVEAGYGF